MKHLYLAVARYADTTHYDYYWIPADTYWEAMYQAVELANKELIINGAKNEYTLYTFMTKDAEINVLNTISAAIVERNELSYFSDLDNLLLTLAEKNLVMSWDIYKQ